MKYAVSSKLAENGPKSFQLFLTGGAGIGKVF